MRPTSSCRLYDYSSPAPSFYHESPCKRSQKLQREQDLKRQMVVAVEQLEHMMPNAGRWSDLSTDVDTLITVLDYIHRYWLFTCSRGSH